MIWEYILCTHIHTHTHIHMSEVVDVDEGLVYIDEERPPPRKKVKTGRTLERCRWCKKWIEQSKLSQHNKEEHLTFKGKNYTPTSTGK